MKSWPAPSPIYPSVASVRRRTGPWGPVANSQGAGRWEGRGLASGLWLGAQGAASLRHPEGRRGSRHCSGGGEGGGFSLTGCAQQGPVAHSFSHSSMYARTGSFLSLSSTFLGPLVLVLGIQQRPLACRAFPPVWDRQNRRYKDVNYAVFKVPPPPPGSQRIPVCFGVWASRALWRVSGLPGERARPVHPLPSREQCIQWPRLQWCLSSG